MSGTQADPRRTFALVVGVEQYAAGQGWSVDGPASDARRFVGWLRSRGVVDENILLFMSPLDENIGLIKADGPQARPATRQEVYTAVTDVLPKKAGDLLYVYWAGHGVITAEGTRRLFYADATDAKKLNLDLNSLLVCLRSDYVPSFDRQICLVDACANYFEAAAWEATLPAETFPWQQPRPGRQQFVLLGAKPGDLATVVTSRKAGMFSEEVISLLNSAPASPWPPDMQALTRQLQQRFTELRAEGSAQQTPAYFWYRDWDSGEGTLGRPTAATQTQLEAPPVSSRPELSFDELARLVTDLTACESMNDRNRRETIVRQLRNSIADNVKRNDVTRFDVMNIVRTCLGYAGGIDELLNVVRFFEGDSSAMQKLVSTAVAIFGDR